MGADNQAESVPERKRLSAIAKIKQDLASRSVTDVPMEHIVLARQHAEELVAEFERLSSQGGRDMSVRWRNRWRKGSHSSKGRGRLIRCTVPGSTPNRSAILRTVCSVWPVASNPVGNLVHAGFELL